MRCIKRIRRTKFVISIRRVIGTVKSYTKKLHEFPVFRAQLWDKLRHAQFEDVCIKTDQRYEDIIRLLQVDESCFSLSQQHSKHADELVTGDRSEVNPESWTQLKGSNET